LEESVRFAELVFPLIGKKPITVENVITSGAFDSRIVAENKNLTVSA
jgi:alkanesulfonate monooxygenase